MNELDRCGELMMASTWIAEQASTRERQHGSHALTAACDEMTGKLGDQRHLALHALEYDGVDAVHVRRDECKQCIERRRALRRQWMDCCHAAPLRRCC